MEEMMVLRVFLVREEIKKIMLKAILVWIM